MIPRGERDINEPLDEIVPVVDTLGRRLRQGKSYKTMTRRQAQETGELIPVVSAAIVIPPKRFTGSVDKDLFLVKTKRGPPPYNDLLPNQWIGLILEHVLASDESPLAALARGLETEVGYKIPDIKEVYHPTRVETVVTYPDPKREGHQIQIFANPYILEVPSLESLTPDGKEIVDLRLMPFRNLRNNVKKGKSPLSAVEPKSFLWASLGAIEDFYNMRYNPDRNERINAA